MFKALSSQEKSALATMGTGWYTERRDVLGPISPAGGALAFVIWTERSKAASAPAYGAMIASDAKRRSGKSTAGAFLQAPGARLARAGW